MELDIKIHKIAQSNVSNVDFSDLPFGKHFTDHYFSADFVDGVWTNFTIQPLEPMRVHPATFVLHYGQSIFEGLKAEVAPDGNPVLFRPDMNAKRFNFSADRMALPEVPEELFIKAITELIKVDAAWIPKGLEEASLYVRPFLYGTDPVLGVKICDTYKFVVMLCPVGAYYTTPVNLLIQERYVRAFTGGTGAAKCAGNYAATLHPVREAKKLGYEQILWVDGEEKKYFQEISTMNIFFLFGNTLVTPSLEDETILNGVTRDSIITLAKELGYTVEERKVSIEELLAAYESGLLKDMFGTGTAAVVYPINSFGYKEKNYPLEKVADRTISTTLKRELTAIKRAQRPDTRGWLLPVGIPQEA